MAQVPQLRAHREGFDSDCKSYKIEDYDMSVEAVPDGLASVLRPQNRYRKYDVLCPRRVSALGSASL